MTQEQLIADLVNWGINAAFLFPFLFPAVVRLYWAWEKSDWGWNIVALDLAVALALLPIFVNHVFNVSVTGYFFGWLEVSSIWLIPVIIVWRMIIIWRNQRRIQ